MSTVEQHLFAPGPKRILALDGGGVKGTVTIAFLEKIEHVLSERSGRGKDFRLSDYFDLVGGTSVGALLATLIALGYSVAEIRSKFEAWAPEIFRHPWLSIPLLTPRFSSRGLRKRARELLGEKTLEDADLKTGLAIITKRIDTGSPWVLTNNPRAKFWNDPDDGSYLGNRHYRIADLLCASTAAPYYFGPKRLRMVPRHTASNLGTGLFVDGAVSPYNNPALMMLMLAGIKGYELQWDLGADRLFMASVGTGSYRMRFEPNFLMRIPAFFATKTILGMMADADQLSLTLLQWLSAPKRPWEINSEIGTMAGELLGPADRKDNPKPLLAFVRYDTRLELPWLTTLGERLKETLDHGLVESLKHLDRPEMIARMRGVGEAAAIDQVTADDFPTDFDPQPGSEPQLAAPTGFYPPLTVEVKGVLWKTWRLLARRRLTPEDFRAVAIKLGTTPRKARRVGLVAARQAIAREEVETKWKGTESRDTAEPGDWIVTTLTKGGDVLRKGGHANTYVVRAEKFPTLYQPHAGENEFGAIYRSKGESLVDVLYLSAGFELMAPWGEMQQSADGYLLLNGAEVYGNNRETFDAAYQFEVLNIPCDGSAEAWRQLCRQRTLAHDGTALAHGVDHGRRAAASAARWRWSSPGAE